MAEEMYMEEIVISHVKVSIESPVQCGMIQFLTQIGFCSEWRPLGDCFLGHPSERKCGLDDE